MNIKKIVDTIALLNSYTKPERDLIIAYFRDPTTKATRNNSEDITAIDTDNIPVNYKRKRVRKTHKYTQDEHARIMSFGDSHKNDKGRVPQGAWKLLAREFGMPKKYGSLSALYSKLKKKK